MARRSSADARAPARRQPWLALTLWLACGPAAAMLALDDDALSHAHAQDGINAELANTNTTTMTQLKWVTDGAATAFGTCTGGTANQHACTQVNNLSLAGSGGPLRINAQLDVGASAVNAGTKAVGLGVTWDPFLLSLGGLTINTPTVDYSARSIGSIGILSQGSLRYVNLNGVFNGSGGALLDFQSSGDLFLREGGAGTPELSFGNFAFNNRFTNGAAGGQQGAAGTIGIDVSGLLITSAFADTDLLFDVAFKAAPTNFDTAGRESITLFGWTGGLVNPTFRVAPGGIAYGSYATTANNLNGASYTFYDHTGTNGGGARSEGLNIGASWDFDSDFAWVIGQAGGNRTQVRFSNWRRLGTSPSPMLSMPVTLDVLQNNTGPLGLCLGGGFTAGTPVQASCTAAGGTWFAGGVPAGRAALATQIRDGHLWAYNQSVEVLDPTSILPYSTYRWSLLYTFGKLDADIYMYPEGRGEGIPLTTTSTGLKSDITLTAQSPGYWDQANCLVSTSATACVPGGGATTANGNAVRAALYTTGAGTRWATNTHFMLADTAVGGNTAVQYGVGIVNADLIWRARDLYFRITDGDSGYSRLPGGLWLQTDTGAQYRFRGLFGGGNLLSMGTPSAIALMDLNLQTSRFIFVLHPVTPVAGDAPVGFSGLLDLDGTSYFSLAEVSSPGSYFRIYNTSGRIGWSDGRVSLLSGQNNPSTGLPELTISNDLLFGRSADFCVSGCPGAPLVGSVGFGNEYFGRLALPGGQWNSEITIKIPGT